jgi:NAD(P)-dependent dehydrogenase (short-subunit alcohol dehydrogenase family)
MLPIPGVAVYNAAKAGIVSLSQSLAAELIGVSVLVPVFTRTRMRENSVCNRPKRFGERTEASQEGKDQLEGLLPLPVKTGRWGKKLLVEFDSGTAAMKAFHSLAADM